MKVKIKKLHKYAIIPKYQTTGASGFDLHSLEDVSLKINETKLIRTGLAFQIPEGFELQIRPRSGLSLKTGLRVTNSPGTVDQDFSGEVCVIVQLVNDGNGVIGYNIKKGDRIAQGVICPVTKAEFEIVEEIGLTERGKNGWGSTGI